MCFRIKSLEFSGKVFQLLNSKFKVSLEVLKNGNMKNIFKDKTASDYITSAYIQQATLNFKVQSFFENK